MSDDFEKAVLFSFDQTGSISPEIRAQAAALLQQAQASPDAWQLCLQRVTTSNYAEVKFWCLQTLHAIAHGPTYPTLDVQVRGQIKQVLVELGTRPPPHQLPPYLRNKAAQTMVAIAAREYPDQWPTFFQDMMSTLGQGPPAVDLFCRILTSIDEDIISLDVPRSTAEAKQSMHFKDTMREGPLPEIASTWCRLVEAYRTTSPDLAAAVLETVQRYVHWIDISLVANDAFMPQLFACLTAPDVAVKGAAADVLTEVVSKRMEAGAKLTLIQNLGVVPECAGWRHGLPGVDEDPGLGLKYAKLLAALATEALEQWKKVENSVLSMQAVGLDISDEAGGEATAACAAASSILDALFPAILATLRNEDDEVAAAMAPFLQSHVSRFRTLQKRNGGVLPPEAAVQVLPIEEAIGESARFRNDSSVYPIMPSTDVDKVASEEEEATIAERRSELFVIFRNVAKLDPSASHAFIARQLQTVLGQPTAVWQDVEVSLSLLYQLGEGAPEESMAPGGSLSSLALAVMTADVPQARHRLVALALLDCCVRYAKVLQQEQQHIPTVLKRFLDEGGMAHPAETVSKRSAYLLCRMCKVLRSQMQPLAADLLTTLQPHLSLIAATPGQEQPKAAGAAAAKAALGSSATTTDDRMYAFEAVGLLLGIEDLPAGEQQAWLQAVLQPLINQIESNMPVVIKGSTGSVQAAALVQHALEAITRIAKGFTVRLTTEIRPATGALLASALQSALAVPRGAPGHKALRTRFLSFLHRMVEALGPGVLPYLPSVLEALLWPGADPTDVADVLGLLNQLMTRFKDSLAALVTEMLPVCISRVHTLLGPDWDWTGIAASTPLHRSRNSSGVFGSGPALGSGALNTATSLSNAVLDGDQGLEGGSPMAAGSTEDVRERAELQRWYHSFLHSLGHSGLSETLLQAPPGVVDVALGSLLQGATCHYDPAVRKTCIQAVSKLVSDWIPAPPEPSPQQQGNTAGNTPVVSPIPSPIPCVPGFKEFAIERFGGSVCFEAVAPPGVDLRDASAISLLTEVSAALKLVEERCGQQFAAHLQTVALPRMGWPQPLAERLVYNVMQSDVKGVKECLKQSLQEMRQAQLGNDRKESR